MLNDGDISLIHVFCFIGYQIIQSWNKKAHQIYCQAKGLFSIYFLFLFFHQENSLHLHAVILFSETALNISLKRFLCGMCLNKHMNVVVLDWEQFLPILF